jgi:predicted polyphosphate/ATP-dependent NAD kinase
VSGTVTRPAGVAGDATVWIVDAPCWQAGTRAFGSVKTSATDTFALQVYVPEGAQLWVCGAVGDGTRPLEIYGQAERAPVLGRGTGAARFTGVRVPLAHGSPARVSFHDARNTSADGRNATCMGPSHSSAPTR